MIGRKLLYGSAFTLLLATIAVRAEAERAAEKAEAWQPLRKEIFALVEKGEPAQAAAKADELLAIVRKDGGTGDEIDALTIRGRVASDPQTRERYYEDAYALAGKTLFEPARLGTAHLAFSHVQQDIGDAAMERNDRAGALRYYQGALEALAAFDLQTYLHYSVSPDARYGPSANELRYIVGWLSLGQGKMEDAATAFYFAEKGMRLSGAKVEDSVRIGLAITAHYRGDRAGAELLVRDVEKNLGSTRGLASAGARPTAHSMIKRARAYFKSGNVAELRW